MTFNPREARDAKGKWRALLTVPHSEVRVGDYLDSKRRVSKMRTNSSGTATVIATTVQGAKGTTGMSTLTGNVKVRRLLKPEKTKSSPKYPPLHASDLSTSDARRSPEVSRAQFQEHAARGEQKYGQLSTDSQSPMALEGPAFKRLTDEAYAKTREPWGGITVDSHTGEHVAVNADKYALSIRKQGADSVTVDPKASREDFDNAMGQARQRFATELSFPGAHLGVFHDADLGRIDIDPVLVTPNLADVHDLGAFTRATGGAYHFKSGDGYWPPHVKGGKKQMSLSFVTPVLHNADYDLSARDGKLAFWKQILPIKTVHYTAKNGSRQQIDFTKEYLEGLAKATAVDSVGFLLADKDNSHTMDPERWRGKVAQFEVRDDGLYGKVVFPSQEAARAVLENPELGVSARIRPNVARSDGSTVPAGIIHVLGTLDPQVSGMGPWQATDLSTPEDDVLDLSEEEYEDTMAEKALTDYTEADIEGMDEKTLDEFLAKFLPEIDTYTESEGDEADKGASHEDDKADEKPELVGAGAGADMSHQGNTDLDLANQRAEVATAQAREALRRVADAEWRETRNAYLQEGVPPHALDLAAPVLNRADDMVIDLSVVNEEDVNVSEAVRGLLDALKGTVDLSAEQGHFGTHSGEDNPDQDILDRWTI